MNIITTFLISSVVTMLKKFATQELFEYIFISTAEAAAKSTNTDWDDRLVDKMKEALGRK